MIGRLTGNLIAKKAPNIVLDVQGVGYEVDVPMTTYYTLPDVNNTLTLYTHQVVREDAHQLYGFSHEVDRDLFRSLIKVNGIGAKIGLAILSGMDANALSDCIVQGDAALLATIPGIGKKTSERLIVELGDRINLTHWQEDAGRGSVSHNVCDQKPVSAKTEAIQALVALGYKRTQAQQMVTTVAQDEMTCEALIREALKGVVR